MLRPVYVVSKSEGARSDISSIIPWIWEFTPKEMRQFCVFVSAENEKRLVCGSGTLTPIGVITAAHLFWFDWQKIFITLYVDEGHYASVPATNIVYQNNPNDIAVVGVPGLKIETSKLPTTLNKKLPDPRSKAIKFYGFGCPMAVFGRTWRPNIVGVSAAHIISRGVVVPGISGGGIFLKDDNQWFLLAVNSYGYLDSKTLYSSRVNF